MEYKTITIEIVMQIPKTDCIAIDEVGDQIIPILEPLGYITGITYYDNDEYEKTK